MRTEGDYEAVLVELEGLINPEPGTPAYDRLEVLSILVESYETEHHPIPLPDPIDAIEFHMDRLGLTRTGLEPHIGSRGRVSEILNRKRPLTLRMIRALEHGLGIPAAILVQAYALVGDDPGESNEKAASPSYPETTSERVAEVAHEATNLSYDTGCG